MSQQNYRNLPLLLLKARESFMKHFRPILKEHSITDQQWLIMQALAKFGNQEPRQLCEHCLILSPSMSGILKRMDEMGYITKVPMEDQRRISIHLTDKGHELYKTIKAKSTQEYHNIEESLGADTIKELYEVLDKVLGGL